MATLNCSICDKPSSGLLNLRQFYLATHIQGVGQVVLPAVLNHSKCYIKVCDTCNEQLNDIIPSAVSKYHLEDSE